MITWNATREEVDAIVKIAERAGANGAKRMPFVMDMEAAHSNGCPLDFQKLLSFPDFDFWHDVYGIQACINRETGELENCFLPRCARKQ